MSARKTKPAAPADWRGVATEVGGKYVEGTFLRSDGVEVARGGWAIMLDTEYLPGTRTNVTRLRARFPSLDGLRMRLYPRDVFSALGALLGLQDVEIGDADFDHAFVIKANNEAKVRALLCDRNVRLRVAAEPRIILAVEDVEAGSPKHYLPADAAQVSCALFGETWDVSRLDALIDVVAATLGRLREIGSAPAAGLCSRCGYNLSGNVSGVCPECGHALPPPPRRAPRRKAEPTTSAERRTRQGNPASRAVITRRWCTPGHDHRDSPGRPPDYTAIPDFPPTDTGPMTPACAAVARGTGGPLLRQPGAGNPARARGPARAAAADEPGVTRCSGGQTGGCGGYVGG